jgi:hypothetical protein
MATGTCLMSKSRVNALSRRVRFGGYRCCVVAVLLVGCKTDCVYYPCPIFEAITVAVSGSGSSGVPPGLAMGIGNSPPQAGMCDGTGICRVFGSPAAYHLTITATGFSPRVVDVTVTGVAAGCNTCGHVDRQQLSIVLQPGV